MALGDLFEGFRRPSFLVESCEIAIEIPFEFVVENHARDDLRSIRSVRFRLIQAVEVRIVFCFAWLGKSVIDGLFVWHAPRFSDQPRTPFGQGEQTGWFVPVTGSGFSDRKDCCLRRRISRSMRAVSPP